MFQHSMRQVVGRVVRQHRHTSLCYNLPAVVLLVHEVHSRPAELGAGGDNGDMHPVTVHALASKRWQQCRVDVQYCARKSATQLSRHELQVASQQHKLDAGALEHVHQF